MRERTLTKPELIAQLSASANKTYEYFKSIMMDTGSYKEASDLSSYYKSPLMFFSSGDVSSARKSFQYIVSNFMKSDGDFITQPRMKSLKSEYTRYYTYTNGWLCRAAIKLSEEVLLKTMLSFMELYVREGFILTNQESELSDVLSVAHYGLIHFELNAKNKAIDAGDKLIRVYDNQDKINSRFKLCFDSNYLPIPSPSQSNNIFFYVDKKKNDQLYFMLAYPAAFLAILGGELGDNKYIEYARHYMNYMLTCDANQLESRFSHKLAWAASLLYKYTNELEYLDVVKKVLLFFVETQDDNGMWFTDEDNNTMFDQSAEIAYWFNEIKANLSSVS